MHAGWKHYWRGLYPWPHIIDEVLQPSDDYTPCVLDVGAGKTESPYCVTLTCMLMFECGRVRQMASPFLNATQCSISDITTIPDRAIELATKYPHIEVIALDLAPPLVPLCVRSPFCHWYAISDESTAERKFLTTAASRCVSRVARNPSRDQLTHDPTDLLRSTTRTFRWTITPTALTLSTSVQPIWACVFSPPAQFLKLCSG